MQSYLFAVQKKTKHYKTYFWIARWTNTPPSNQIANVSQIKITSPGGNHVRFIDAFQDIDHDALIGAAMAEHFLVVGDFPDLAVKENWKTERRSSNFGWFKAVFKCETIRTCIKCLRVILWHTLPLKSFVRWCALTITFVKNRNWKSLSGSCGAYDHRGCIWQVFVPEIYSPKKIVLKRSFHIDTLELINSRLILRRSIIEDKDISNMMLIFYALNQL